jgi:hypothetical protein
VEPEQDVEAAPVASGRPAEAGEPGQGAPDHPTVPAQALAAVDPAPGDARDDTSFAAGAAAAVVVVPPIRVRLGRAPARPAGALPDRRHGVGHRFQLDL